MIDILLYLDVWLILYCFQTYDWDLIGITRIIDILLGLDVSLIFYCFPIHVYTCTCIYMYIHVYTCIYMYIHAYTCRFTLLHPWNTFHNFATSNRHEWGQKKSYRGFRTTPRTGILRSFFLEWSWLAIGAIGQRFVWKTNDCLIAGPCFFTKSAGFGRI